MNNLLDVEGTFFWKHKRHKSSQKRFHKSWVCCMSGVLLCFKQKTFCENPFVNFESFVFQKKTSLLCLAYV